MTRPRWRQRNKFFTWSNDHLNHRIYWTDYGTLATVCGYQPSHKDEGYSRGEYVTCLWCIATLSRFNQDDKNKRRRV